jgi:hypothetical protein
VWIQLLLILAVIVIGGFLMRRTGADSHLAIRRLGMALFVIAAILAILFPQSLSWVANLVGVGRGTDLLLYALVIVFLAVIYTQYRHNLAAQRKLTLLTRRIALLEAEQGEDEPAGEPAQPDAGAAPGEVTGTR